MSSIGDGDRESASRPLVIRCAEMGDTILLTSMLRILTARYRAPCDVVVKAAWSRTVLAGLPCVGEVRGIRSRKRPYWISPEKRSLARWLRSRGPTPTYVVDDVPALDAVLDRAGIRPEWRVTARRHPWRKREHHHVVFLAELARHDPVAIGGRAHPVEDPPPSPSLRVTAEELDDARRFLSVGGRDELGRDDEGRLPVVVMQTQSRKADRGRWPEERWAALARELVERDPEIRVILAGTPAESSAVRAIARRCAHSRVRHASDDLPMRRLFGVLASARACVSLDTGPAHAAAALGCPTVVLAGISDPRRYRPVGRPGAVEVVGSVPEHAWPEDRNLRHDTAAIPLEAVRAALERVTAV